MVERRGECESGEFRGESTIMTVRKEEERSQEVKRREKSNWRCPHTRQKGRGHEVKTKGRETNGQDKVIK